MKIGNEVHIFTDNDTNNVSEQTRDSKRAVSSIYAGNLKMNMMGKQNIEDNPIARRRQEAREKAMKVVADAFADEQEIDNEIALRQEKINKYNQTIRDALDGISEYDDMKEALKEQYGITDDSEEQADLELIEKRNKAIRSGDFRVLTEKELERLEHIDRVGKTEYQKRALELEQYKGIYNIELDAANMGIIEENAMIRGINIERLKSHAMVDATNQADDINRAASKEIVSMLIDEAKEHVEEVIEETEQEAAQKREEKEEEEERLEAIREDADKTKKSDNDVDIDVGDIPIENLVKMDQLSDTAKQEIDNIVDRLNLITDDIKGAVVDREV